MNEAMGSRGGTVLMFGVVAFLVFDSLAGTTTAARIIVGDSAHWTFGFNYTDWAIKRAPFYKNDTLVFMYEAPNGTAAPHNVFLLKNLRRFLACDLSKATLLANPVQGGGAGFEFVLKKRKPHYLVCGEGSGAHCKFGQMKFSVLPVKRCHGLLNEYGSLGMVRC